MLGLMLAGLEVALARPTNIWAILGGSALVATAVGIKVTAVLALAFMVIMLARGRGGRWRDLFMVAADRRGSVGGGVRRAESLGGGRDRLAHGARYPGDREVLPVGQHQHRPRRGGHRTAARAGRPHGRRGDDVQPVGTAAAAAISLALMWRTWRGHLDPLVGLGLSLGAFVLLGPVIQPWYLLWAVLPLAAATHDPAFGGRPSGSAWCSR